MNEILKTGKIEEVMKKEIIDVRDTSYNKFKEGCAVIDAKGQLSCVARKLLILAKQPI